MASVSSHQAEQPVFCQHLLKPIEHQPGAYRCVYCGQVGDMRDRTIIWREQNPDLAARGRGRAGGVSPEAVLGILVAASVVVCTFVWCCRVFAGPVELQPVAAAVELQPIPLEEAAEQDSGCCGGDPQELYLCQLCVDEELEPGVTVRRCYEATCRDDQLCRIRRWTNPSTGRTLWKVDCVDTLERFAEDKEWII